MAQHEKVEKCRGDLGRLIAQAKIPSGAAFLNAIEAYIDAKIEAAKQDRK